MPRCAELLAHQMLGAASCPAFSTLIDQARREGWRLDGGEDYLPGADRLGHRG
jgi:hypothetical protein